MMSSSRERPRRASVETETFGSKIAFFNANTLVARELRSLLENRGFPTMSVKLFDAQDKGTLSEYGGEALVATSPSEEATLDLDIAFMCGSASDTVRYLDWAAQRGFIAVDMSGASRTRLEVPTIHTEINPGEMRPESSIVAAPHPVSHNLATLVAPAREAGRISSVDALALRPASDMGEKAISELYQQAIGLLNLCEVPKEVFGRQMAFNVLPSTGMLQSRVEEFDRRMTEESARILGMDSSMFSVTSAFVPVFHGHALSVTMVFEEAVAVLGPVLDERHPNRAGFWTFCDNLKGGATLNVVRIAERLTDMRREMKR